MVHGGSKKYRLVEKIAGTKSSWLLLYVLTVDSCITIYYQMIRLEPVTQRLLNSAEILFS